MALPTRTEHKRLVKVVARTSDRGQRIWRWGDRLVIRGNTAGNRERPARLTLELDGNREERIVVPLRRSMSPADTLVSISCSLPPTYVMDAQAIEENAVAFRLMQRS